MELIADLKDILDRVERRMEIIKTELIDVKERFGTSVVPPSNTAVLT